MTDIDTYIRQGVGVEAATFVTKGTDPVAVERYDDLVLVSWPTGMPVQAVLRLFRQRVDSVGDQNAVTLYAGTSDVAFDHEDGDPIDWDELDRHDEALEYVRLELEDETLVWNRPEGPHEHENRLASLATSMESRFLFELVAATAAREVLLLFETVLGDNPWTIQAIPALR